MTVTDAVTDTAPPSTGRRDIGLLTATTVAIGLSNYVMSLAVVRLLPASQFTEFAAAQGLLLVLGTGSLAAVPWAVARHLATTPGTESRKGAMWFGLVSSLIQGVALAVVGLAVCWVLGGPVLGVIAAAGGLLISVMAAPIGFFQGLQRFRVLAALRTVETGVRILASLALLLAVSRDADLALLGFPIGSAVAIAYAMYRARDVFPLQRLPREHATALVRQAVALGVVQVLLSALAALDTVYAGVGGFSAEAGASYQSAALIARIPLFFSSAVSIAAFTSLVAAPDDAAVGRGLRECLRTYAWLTTPFLVAGATVPASVVAWFIPAEYVDTVPVLRILCVSGALIGLINVVTTAAQARTAYRTCTVVLTVAVLAQAVVLLLVGRTGHVAAFAAAMTAVSVVTALLVVADARRWLTGRSGRGLHLRWQHAVVVVGAAVAALVRSDAVWIGALVLTAGVCAVAAVRGRPADPTPTVSPAPTRPLDLPVSPT